MPKKRSAPPPEVLGPEPLRRVEVHVDERIICRGAELHRALDLPGVWTISAIEWTDPHAPLPKGAATYVVYNAGERVFISSAVATFSASVRGELRNAVIEGDGGVLGRIKLELRIDY
jgi:hypothetical protein